MRVPTPHLSVAPSTLRTGERWVWRHPGLWALLPLPARGDGLLRLMHTEVRGTLPRQRPLSYASAREMTRGGSPTTSGVRPEGYSLVQSDEGVPLKSTLPIFSSIASVPGSLPEERECSAPSGASCHPEACSGRGSVREALRDALGLACVASSSPSGTEPSMPVSLSNHGVSVHATRLAHASSGASTVTSICPPEASELVQPSPETPEATGLRGGTPEPRLLPVSRLSRNAGRAPSPPREQSGSREPRSFVDVLSCLM